MAWWWPGGGWGRGRGWWSWGGRGPFSWLPPWLRPGWLFGRGACRILFPWLWWYGWTPWTWMLALPYYYMMLMPYYYAMIYPTMFMYPRFW